MRCLKARHYCIQKDLAPGLYPTSNGDIECSTGEEESTKASCSRGMSASFELFVSLAVG